MRTMNATSAELDDLREMLVTVQHLRGVRAGVGAKSASAEALAPAIEAAARHAVNYAAALFDAEGPEILTVHSRYGQQTFDQIAVALEHCLSAGLAEGALEVALRTVLFGAVEPA